MDVAKSKTNYFPAHSQLISVGVFGWAYILNMFQLVTKMRYMQQLGDDDDSIAFARYCTWHSCMSQCYSLQIYDTAYFMDKCFLCSESKPENTREYTETAKNCLNATAVFWFKIMHFTHGHSNPSCKKQKQKKNTNNAQNYTLEWWNQTNPKPQLFNTVY